MRSIVITLHKGPSRLTGISALQTGCRVFVRLADRSEGYGHTTDVRIAVGGLRARTPPNRPRKRQALKRIDPAVKVIGVSGLGSEAVLAEAGKDDVQAFLKKPYATASLLTTLREVLNGEN